MNNKIDTILFDLDGTLIDTNELIIRSFLHTLNHYFPDQYKREDVLPFIGPTLTETFQSINPEKLDEMVKMYREYNWKEHDSLVTEFDGVYETVKKLKEHGFRLGIVTTKIYEVVLKGLQLTKLEPFFDVVVALDHVQKAKPDPEPIFKALELLGSKPENAIMVGDNYHDIMAGKNAGTRTAGVAWAIKGKASLLKYDPDYMLENMRDLLPIVGAESE